VDVDVPLPPSVESVPSLDELLTVSDVASVEELLELVQPANMVRVIADARPIANALLDFVIINILLK
jgi:hypothetical protein